MAIASMVSKSFKKARMITGLAKNTLVFKLKRKALRRRFRFGKIETIVVDMDGTLFESDAGKEALNLTFSDLVAEGIPNGELIYNFIMRRISHGIYSVEDAIINGNKLLAGKGFRRADFRKVLEICKKGLRWQLIQALKDIKKETGAKIILATLSSIEFSQDLNDFLRRKHGFKFDGVIGSSLLFDRQRRIAGLKEIIGTKNKFIGDIRVRTKLKAIRDLFHEKGWRFDLNTALLITDGYGDIDLAKDMKTVLLKPRRMMNMAQRVSQKLKLADAIVKDDEQLRENLLKVIRAR